MAHLSPNPTTPTQRDWSLTLILMGVFVTAFVVPAWNSHAIDMSALYMGGWLAGADALDVIYGATPTFAGDPVDPRWKDSAAIAGFTTDEPPLAYIYPPIWAILLSGPAHATDPAMFFNATRAILGVAYCAAVLGTWRLLRPSLSLPAFTLGIFILSLLSMPFMFAWMLVQPQILVIAMTIWSFERLQAGKSAQAGMLLGAAAAFKIAPIFFLVIFLAEKDWRATSWALGVSGGIAALSVLLAGWDAHLAFLDAVATVNGLNFFLAGNLTFETLVQGTFFANPDVVPPHFPLVAYDVTWISTVSKALMLATVVAILWATRAVDPSIRIAGRLIVLVPVLNFFSPLAWAHYYLPVLLLVFALYGRLPTRLWALSFFAAFSMSFIAITLPLAGMSDGVPILQYYQTPFLVLVFTTVMIGMRPDWRGARNAQPHAIPAE